MKIGITNTELDKNQSHNPVLGIWVKYIKEIYVPFQKGAYIS